MVRLLLEQWCRLLEELSRLLEKVTRLLELEWILKTHSSFLVSLGLKKMCVSFILEHCCEILEQIIGIFENPAAILDKKEPILEHPADILEDCYFIRI